MDLETSLRARFDVREERFAHGDHRFDLMLPQTVDDLLDEAEFARDQRIPYWAELWPAARALAGRLLDAAPPAGRVLELGCGLALPSLALRRRGADVVATDYYADALLFARANAARNGLDLATTLLDWREPGLDQERFDLIVAADALYEDRHVAQLAAALERLLAPRGEVLLADPDRRPLPSFVAAMRAGGWQVVQEARVAEPQAGAARPVTVVLLRLSR